MTTWGCRSAVSHPSHSPRMGLKQTRRTCRPAARPRRAASIARRVLPVPAGPTKATRGFASMASRATYCSWVYERNSSVALLALERGLSYMSKSGRSAWAIALHCSSVGTLNSGRYHVAPVQCSTWLRARARIRRMMSVVRREVRAAASATCQECHSGLSTENSMYGKKTADQKRTRDRLGARAARRRRTLCMASAACLNGPRGSGEWSAP